MKTPTQIEILESTSNMPMSIRRGFLYTKSPKENWQIGSAGAGGQMVRYDFDNELSIAYLCNGLKLNVHKCVKTYDRIEEEIYKCL